MNSKVYAYFWSGVCIVIHHLPLTAQTDYDPENPASINELHLNGYEEQEAVLPINFQSAADQMDVNLIKESDLESLHIVPPSQIDLILNYIAIHKPLLSVYELQTIEGLDLELVRQLSQYLYVEKDQAITKNVHDPTLSNGHIILGWSKTLDPEGAYFAADSFKSSYAGSPDRAYLKFKMSLPHDMQIGMNLDKDPGESWVDSRAIGYIDHISGYLKMEHLNKWIQSFYLGDYHLRIARGLLMSNGLFRLEGLDPAFAINNKTFLKAYQASGENDMLRGIASEFKLPNPWTALAFYSQTRIDAHLETQSNGSNSTEISGWTRLLTSGYHRTISELEQRKNLKEEWFGGHMGYRFSAVEIGLSLLHRRFNMSNFKEPFAIPTNMDMSFISVDYKLHSRNMRTEGEIASDPFGHVAHAHTSLLGLGKKCSFNISYSHYDPGFYSNRSQVNSQSTYSWNEERLNLGMQLQPHYKLQMNISGNFSTIPLPESTIGSKQAEWDYHLSISYTERKKYKVRLQFHTIQSLTLFESERTHDIRSGNHIIQTQAYLEQIISRNLDWKLRAIWKKNLSGGIPSQGIAFAIDGRYKFPNGKWTANGRIVLFDIHDYQVRIFINENDVRYHFNLSALSGKGIRMYLNLRYKPVSKLTLEAKFEVTTLHEQAENRALKPLDKNYSREIKLQMLYSF